MSSPPPAPVAPQPADPAKLFGEATRQHQAGHLPQAERLYRQVLAADPGHADALHQLGGLASQCGRPDVAASLIAAAIAINGSIPAWHFNLGVALLTLGRCDESATAFRAAIALRPNSAEAYANLGVALQGSGHSHEALAAYRAALRIQPVFPVAQFNQANALHTLGRLDEAVGAYKAAIRLRPAYPEAYSNLGRVLFGQGRFEEAVSAYRAALRLKPDFAEVKAGLGAALTELERFEEAVSAYRDALRLQPEDVNSLTGLGAALHKAARFEEALTALRDAVRLKPDHATGYSLIGSALARTGRFAEAVSACREAMRLAPDLADAHTNLGAALFGLGEFAGAEDAFREALRLKPEDAATQANLGAALRVGGHHTQAVSACREAVRLDPEKSDARYNLGLALLTRGDLAEGWQEYEWRWRTDQLAAAWRDLARPQWHGEAAEGKTLLVWAEQGLGDTLQFCRYVPLLARRGMRVVLEVPRPLARLLGTLEGGAEIVASGAPLPPFDLHCPMLSLPLAFGTTRETIPGNTPYLSPDPGQGAAWKARLDALPGAGPRIGLVWAGNPRPDQPIVAAIDRRRSIPPRLLAPLMEVPGVRFFSLQKGGPAVPADFPLIDFMGEMHDFADTAALAAHLDLVIAVDTAGAHLAGALGKPVWLLDRFDHCWRWIADRRDSPWYPSLRIYRQPAPGEWAPVITQVVSDLREVAASFRGAGA